MERGTLGELVVVVDCPDERYLPALQAALPDVCCALRPHDAGRMRVLVHLTAERVASTAAYGDWLAALPPAQHLMCGRRFDAARDPPSLWSATRQ